MSPPIPKDWWLAAALTGASLPAALAQTAPPATARQTGVVTTVRDSGPGTSRPLYIEGTEGQKLVTGPRETIHVLFSDQSALTVGPNTEVTITKYSFNPQTRDGGIALDMAKGLLRVVGGFLSKRQGTVIKTATSTLGIRGGISDIQATEDNTQADFHFGIDLTSTDLKGNTERLNRPGFSTSSTRNGHVGGGPKRMNVPGFNRSQANGGDGSLGRISRDRVGDSDRRNGDAQGSKTNLKNILNSEPRTQS